MPWVPFKQNPNYRRQANRLQKLNLDWACHFLCYFSKTLSAVVYQPAHLKRNSHLSLKKGSPGHKADYRRRRQCCSRCRSENPKSYWTWAPQPFPLRWLCPSPRKCYTTQHRTVSRLWKGKRPLHTMGISVMCSTTPMPIKVNSKIFFFSSKFCPCL